MDILDWEKEGGMKNKAKVKLVLSYIEYAERSLEKQKWEKG